MLDRQLPLLTRRELYGTVFLSTHDELVSHKDVGEVLARHTPKLEVHFVSSEGGSSGHLMLDEYSLGSRELCGAIAAITTQMDTPLLSRRQTTATSYTNVSHPPSPRPDPPQ